MHQYLIDVCKIGLKMRADINLLQIIECKYVLNVHLNGMYIFILLFIRSPFEFELATALLSSGRIGDHCSTPFNVVHFSVLASAV